MKYISSGSMGSKKCIFSNTSIGGRFQDITNFI